MIRFVLDEPDVHRADMDRVACLAREITVFELVRPRGLEHVGATLALIEDLVAALR